MKTRQTPDLKISIGLGENASVNPSLFEKLTRRKNMVINAIEPEMHVTNFDFRLSFISLTHIDRIQNANTTANIIHSPGCKSVLDFQ